MKIIIDLLHKYVKITTLLTFLLFLFLLIILLFTCNASLQAEIDEQYKYELGKIIQYYPSYKEFKIISNFPVFIENKNIHFTRVELTLPYKTAKNRTTVVYTIR